MKVLHVLRADHERNRGGDVVQLESLVSALQNAGVDVVARTLDAAPETVDIVHLYNLDRGSELVRDWQNVRERWPRARVVLAPVFLPWNASRLARAADPWMLYAAARHEIDLRRSWRGLRRVLGGADGIVTCSAAEAAATSRHFRVPADARWHIARNGIAPAQWDVERTSEVRAELLDSIGIRTPVNLVVACAGRIEPLKNQIALVRSVAALGDAALVLAGRPEASAYAHQVAKLAAALPQDRVMLGELDQPSLARVLAATDVHVLPSFREVVGLSTLEAAAAGCAVVATTGPIVDYLGDAAEYCEPTTRSIGAAIERARRAVSSSEARVRARACTWEASAQAVISCYEDVMTARRQR